MQRIGRVARVVARRVHVRVAAVIRRDARVVPVRVDVRREEDGARPGGGAGSHRRARPRLAGGRSPRPGRADRAPQGTPRTRRSSRRGRARPSSSVPGMLGHQGRRGSDMRPRPRSPSTRRTSAPASERPAGCAATGPRWWWGVAQSSVGGGAVVVGGGVCAGVRRPCPCPSSAWAVRRRTQTRPRTASRPPDSSDTASRPAAGREVPAT